MPASTPLNFIPLSLVLLPAVFAMVGSAAAQTDSNQRAATNHQSQSSSTPSGGQYLVYIGTYTRSGASQGIYAYRMDLSSGELTPIGVTTGIANPSFLALDPSNRFLYSVAEVSEGEKRTGAVSAFSVNRTTGELTKLNHQSSEGAGPCYVSVDTTGSVALVANYGSGSIASLPIDEQGRLQPAASAIQHEGSSVNERRQEGPHAHSIMADPANRFVLAADLGTDKLMIYRLDAKTGQLTPNEPASVSLEPGSGPRHFAFHPNGRFVYVINELTSTITAFAYDGQRGALEPLHTTSTLPEGFEGQNSTAEILVHPSGKFVYGSNRGHNSIAIFAVDEQTGQLTAAGHQSTGGETPRNFRVDPTGKYLLAANQQTDNVVVLRIDDQTGKLNPTGQELQVPTPVCIKFVPVEP